MSSINAKLPRRRLDPLSYENLRQRVLHRDLAIIRDDQGRPVKHTPEFVTQLFDEELARLLRELPASAAPEETERFRRARQISEAMIVNGEFNPV